MSYPTAADLSPKDAARLRASYVIDSETGCWVWVRGRTTAGYGHFHFRGAYYQAHRFVYGVTRGPIAADLEPDHLCRNRACVFPDHVEPVSHSINVARGLRGRLTPADVRAIRASAGESQRDLGRRFGVDHSTICRVLNGSRWLEAASRALGEDVAA